MINGIAPKPYEPTAPVGEEANQGWPDWTKGFKFPWETPAGQGFQAPWTGVNPLAPTQPTGPTGPNYGPYNDPGQIPPELLERYDWEPYDQSYIDESGKTAKVTRYRLIPKATMTPYQEWQTGQAGATSEGYPLPSGQEQTTWDEGGNEWFWNEYSGRYEQTGRYNQAYDMGLQQQQAQESTPEAMSDWQRAQMELAQQQLAAEQGWKQQEYGLEQQQYASQLAAQPKSWLEYAAYTGQPPVVQPFMLPLMPQEYAGLEGLRAGQPIPGWPEQFTGSNAPYQPYGGQGTQPSTPTDQYAGTTGAGVTGAGAGITGAGTAGGGWQPMNADQYLAAGLSPAEAEQAALHDLAYQNWSSMPSGMGTPDKSIAYLQTGQIASERPETQERYQQAIGNLQSGDPLLRDISSREKMQLVTQMINQGMDRTLAERQVFGGSPAFSKYTPISSLADTSTPEVSRWLGAATTGESRTASYPEPSKPLPTPTEPTPLPTGLAPKPFEPKKTLAYIPGRSWHDTEGESNESLGKATWLARMQKLPGEGTQQAQSSQYPLGGMPEMVRPSRQYQARMGPTALQQYYAYNQARTGTTPEELQWRLRNTAPPGGGYSGLTWMR